MVQIQGKDLIHDKSTIPAVEKILTFKKPTLRQNEKKRQRQQKNNESISEF